MGEDMAKKRTDEKINIYIDPTLKAEMLAEAQKTPEQRQADKDMLFALMGDAMINMGKSMIPNPKKSPPLKQPPKTIEQELIQDSDYLEIS
jgi:hypothetical protein